MSSNAMQVLRRVLVDNDLAYCFAHVFGGDVTPDKRTAIATFLADGGSGFGRRCLADYDERPVRYRHQPRGVRCSSPTRSAMSATPWRQASG